MNKPFAVLAIITNGSNILSVTRKGKPDQISFPGGKVEPNETPDMAIVREVKEETGLTVEEFEPFFQDVDDDGNESRVYIVTKYSGDLVSEKGTTAFWNHDIMSLAVKTPYPEFNKKVISKICMISPVELWHSQHLKFQPA